MPIVGARVRGMPASYRAGGWVSRVGLKEVRVEHM